MAEHREHCQGFVDLDCEQHCPNLATHVADSVGLEGAPPPKGCLRHASEWADYWRYMGWEDAHVEPIS